MLHLLNHYSQYRCFVGYPTRLILEVNLCHWLHPEKGMTWQTQHIPYYLFHPLGKFKTYVLLSNYRWEKLRATWKLKVESGGFSSYRQAPSTFHYLFAAFAASETLGGSDTLRSRGNLVIWIYLNLPSGCWQLHCGKQIWKQPAKRWSIFKSQSGLWWPSIFFSTVCLNLSCSSFSS